MEYEIIEVVWFWVNLVPVNQVALRSNRSKTTVVDWYDYCRDIPVSRVLNHRLSRVLNTMGGCYQGRTARDLF